jgi:hypothetical protein
MGKNSALVWTWGGDGTIMQAVLLTPMPFHLVVYLPDATRFILAGRHFQTYSKSS